MRNGICLSACLISGALLAHGSEPSRVPGEFEPSFAVMGKTAILAWYEYRGQSSDIYIQRVDPERGRLGEPTQLTSDDADSFEPDIVLLDDAVVVAWYDKDAKSKRLTPKLGVWSQQGELRWTRVLASEGRNPVVRTHGGRVFAAWIEGSGATASVRGRWFDRAGVPAALPVELGVASESTWNLNATVDPSGRAWVAFDAKLDTRRSELYLASTLGGETSTARISDDDGYASKYPDVVIANGRLALAWFDERDGNQEVYFAVVAPDTANIEAHARRVTHTPGHSIGAYLAWNGDLLGLAWCDDTSGRYQVWLAMFDAKGEQRAAPALLSQAGSRQWVPAIQAWGDGFAAIATSSNPLKPPSIKMMTVPASQPRT